MVRESRGARLPAAQRVLGVSYVNGQVVPKDFVMAVEWFEKAAERGEAQAIQFVS
ncbi:MAG: SEL1-like repeat protein [Deltaproteobacteria bacterium]|nr:SEL1-like repeat protein [Deltaproteobacteria bacterium]